MYKWIAPRHGRPDSRGDPAAGSLAEQSSWSGLFD
jgi:hypothetical protein